MNRIRTSLWNSEGQAEVMRVEIIRILWPAYGAVVIEPHGLYKTNDNDTRSPMGITATRTRVNVGRSEVKVCAIPFLGKRYSN
jgi:hypothetical protein